MNRSILPALLLLAACSRETAPPPPTITTPPPDARQQFGSEVASQLLDTQLYEMKGTLLVAEENPNRYDESPVAQREVPHPATPGPHTLNGVLYADIDVLRALLEIDKPLKIEGDRVYVGNPEVAILGHRHGQTLYVPVKLFARQFGAYVRISSTLATAATVWPPKTLEHLRKHGSPQAPVLLEAHAEGILRGIDVRKPAGN